MARPRVLIVGAGFGGLATTRALAKAPVDITLIDRTNHHLFQPLLYQVAMAGLSPADIASPVRSVVRRQRNVQVLLGEVSQLSVSERTAQLRDRQLSWDYLVLATGGQTNYFGHPEWEPHAPGLKNLDDALEIRRRVLLAFEAAEKTSSNDLRRALLTFVVIGGGPTGVEIAGSIAELARFALARDFRTIAPSQAQILLVEAGPRLLPSFHPDLSERAAQSLARLGVTVRCHTMVRHIDATSVRLGDDELPSMTKIWAAGICATSLTEQIVAADPTVRLDGAGRIIVDASLRVGRHEHTFAIGDMVRCEQDGVPLPGVSPVAMQMGRFVAGEIARRARTHRSDANKPQATHVQAAVEASVVDRPGEFRYRDKGSMATIGRHAAVVQIGQHRLHGALAWLTWLWVHLVFLIGFRNRFAALFNWAWSYVTYQRGARLITGRVHWTGSAIDHDGTLINSQQAPGHPDDRPPTALTPRETELPHA